jgi:hypothetical protein
LLFAFQAGTHGAAEFTRNGVWQPKLHESFTVCLGDDRFAYFSSFASFFCNMAGIWLAGSGCV